MRWLMDKIVDIEGRTLWTDDLLTEEESWGRKWVGLPARIEPLSSRERMLYMREGAETTHRLYCEKVSGLTVRETDRIVCDGRVYEVVGVLEGGDLIEVELKELK